MKRFLLAALVLFFLVSPADAFFGQRARARRQARRDGDRPVLRVLTAPVRLLARGLSRAGRGCSR